MTEKEKAKAYDEALKKASAAHKDEDRHLKATLERIFPELKEDDDERIKKAIIEFFESEDDNTTCSLVQKKDIIAWLEKQGKNSTDKNKPKFNVGDWVVNKFGDSWHIDSLDKKDYQVSDGKGNYNYFPISKQDEMHLWTIQDAKDGDIICYKDEISLYKNEIENYNKQETTFGGFTYYCCYDGKSFITNSFYTLIEQDKIDIYPATKEQRDTLMKAMNNAGYEWDAENKELKKED